MRAGEASREKSPRHWKTLAQLRLRQVLAMLEDDRSRRRVRPGREAVAVVRERGW